MKPLNTMLLAVATAALRTQSSDAFIPNLISSREAGTHPPPSSSSTVRNPSSVVMHSSVFDNASPNDQVIREEYAKWRQKYSKGEFDALRYENFKANFMAVTVRNNMERTRARQNGEAAPSQIALNEFGDCSADEYRTAMGQQQQFNSSGPRRVASANSQPASTQGLQPSNTIINTPSKSRNSNNNRSADLTNASAQLRAVIQERTSMERELVEMKKLLEEKKKLLENATKEEQACQERLALREEQKRLLNDRLANGWDDERGMNDNYY